MANKRNAKKHLRAGVAELHEAKATCADHGRAAFIERSTLVQHRMAHATKCNKVVATENLPALHDVFQSADVAESGIEVALKQT